MKHTAVFSRQQRTVRSKLAKIVHDKGLVRGTIITMKRTCGNPNCRCARGKSMSPSICHVPKAPHLFILYAEMVKTGIYAEYTEYTEYTGPS